MRKYISSVLHVNFYHEFIQLQGQESVPPPLNRPAIEEEMGDGSGGYEQNGGHSNNDQDSDSVHQTPASKKRFSPHQIQELEAYELKFN